MKKRVCSKGFFACVQFTQDDAHIFCLPDQIELQISEVIDFIVHIYGVFGFTDYKMELSTRPENFIGSPEIWEKAEGALEKKYLDEKKIVYKINVGDGAFYGPKNRFSYQRLLEKKLAMRYCAARFFDAPNVLSWNTPTRRHEKTSVRS